MTRRQIIGTLLFLCLILGSVAVLAFATAWAPTGSPRCFIDLAHSQFPGWLGCALAVHEALSGSLIAASGALFGGWLAYVALAEQAAISRADQREARRLALDQLVKETGRDVDLMRAASGFVSAIAEKFPADEAGGTGPSAFSSTLLDLRTAGYLRPSSRAVLAPDGNGESVETVMNRLNDLAHNLHEGTKGLSGEQNGAELRRRNSLVASQIKDLRALAALLEGSISKYQAKFEDAADELNAFQNQPRR